MLPPMNSGIYFGQIFSNGCLRYRKQRCDEEKGIPTWCLILSILKNRPYVCVCVLIQVQYDIWSLRRCKSIMRHFCTSDSQALNSIRNITCECSLQNVSEEASAIFVHRRSHVENAHIFYGAGLINILKSWIYSDTVVNIPRNLGAFEFLRARVKNSVRAIPEKILMFHTQLPNHILYPCFWTIRSHNTFHFYWGISCHFSRTMVTKAVDQVLPIVGRITISFFFQCSPSYTALVSGRWSSPGSLAKLSEITSW